MGYSRRTLNYIERITLSDPTHMISMADLVDISVETPSVADSMQFHALIACI